MHSLLIIGLVAGLGGLASALQAAEDSIESAMPKSEAVGKKDKPFPLQGKISVVNSVEKTITLEGKEKNRIIQVTSQTRLTKDGKPATFDAAVVGEEVGASVRKIGENRYEALSLRLGDKSEATPRRSTPTKSKKTKETPAQQ